MRSLFGTFVGESNECSDVRCHATMNLAGLSNVAESQSRGKESTKGTPLGDEILRAIHIEWKTSKGAERPKRAPSAICRMLLRAGTRSGCPDWPLANQIRFPDPSSVGVF